MILIVNIVRGVLIFILLFLVYFWDFINQKVFDYMYIRELANFKKDRKIVGIYFSIHTFENLQRRYVKEFYFLEKFLASQRIPYLIITDYTLDLLDQDIDLLIVNDARYIPASTILHMIEYSQKGKILFTYQSLMYNSKGQKHKNHLLYQLGLYDIVFVNRDYNYFSFKHFTKILLSRKYCVEYYTDSNNVLGFTSNKTPFLVKAGNVYFLAENTFCVENLSNQLIYKFNSYLIRHILDDMHHSSMSFKFSNLELVMPIEFIITHPKTRRYFSFSKKMRKLLSELVEVVESRVLYPKLMAKGNVYLKVSLSRVDNVSFKRFGFRYGSSNFVLFIRYNRQGGIEDYWSYRYEKIESKREEYVIDVELEDYIMSVVTSEMPDYFELEALKAQALAARTYAVKNLSRHTNFDLCDLPHCQNFEGEKKETFKSFIATLSTKGEIITYKGNPIDAVYHSTCGGITANSEDVWNTYVPYLRKVKDYETNLNDSNCKQSRLFTWIIEIPLNKANKILSKTIPYLLQLPYEGSLKSIKVYKNSSQRVQKMIIQTDLETYVAYKDDSIYLFSEDLYYSMLPSNFIEKVEIKDGIIRFYGRGFGHGVGMCQFGANKLGTKLSYRQIIKHYYKGVSIGRI
ncbi:MAG: SpoIID/LytB domain-containing protein [bacterium]